MKRDRRTCGCPRASTQASPPTGNFGWNAIGRLKEGVRPDQAATHLEPLVQRAMSEYIQSANYRAFLTDGRYRPLVHAMKEDVIGSVREPLWILLGTVGMVLLVACGNVANLCLIRAEARQREIAVRVALGGSRAGLVRKLLAEALVLSAIGAVLGVLFSAAALPILLQLAPDTIPRLDRVRVDGTVLLFAAAASIVSALIFGLAPAIRYTRPNILACLRHGGRSATDHPGRQRGRHLLVIAQTAMALVLLVGSGLLARSFARLMQSDQGFVAENVLTFRVALPERTYPKGAEVVRVTSQLVDRLAELPSVEAAGATTDLPMAGSPEGTAFEFDGRPHRSGTPAADRRLFDGDAGILRDAARARPARLGLRLGRSCATARGRSSSTRRPRISTGPERRPSASAFARRGPHPPISARGTRSRRRRRRAPARAARPAPADDLLSAERHGRSRAARVHLRAARAERARAGRRRAAGRVGHQSRPAARVGPDHAAGRRAIGHAVLVHDADAGHCRRRRAAARRHRPLRRALVRRQPAHARDRRPARARRAALARPSRRHGQRRGHHRRSDWSSAQRARPA